MGEEAPESIVGMEREHAWPPDMELDKLSHVRSTLREIGLCPERIECALRAHGSGGDLNFIASYALSLEPECISEVRVLHREDVARGIANPKDMVSSEDGASEADPMERWVQAANRLGGSIPQPPATDIIKPQKRECEGALLSVKREEPNPNRNPHTDCETEGRNLHGDGWQDPICKLFRIENNVTCNLGSLDAGRVCTGMDNIDGRDASSSRVKLENLGSGDIVRKGKEIMDFPESSKNVVRTLPPSEVHHREASFRDMGFPPELIQRALQLHGAQPDDSILLQFLLDCTREDYAKNQENSDFNMEQAESSTFVENCSGLVTIRQQITESMKKNGAKLAPGSDDDDSLGSDFDDDNNVDATHNAEETPSRTHSLIYSTVTTECEYPALCKREPPADSDYRHLLSNQGFSADLVERALQELGEDAEYERLLEYILYLVVHQDTNASSSDQAAICKRVSTVEKLVKECGYPTKAVERAMLKCETPLWDAEQDQIADVIEFLEAHGEQLNEYATPFNDEALESEENRTSDDEESTDWAWLRQPIEEDSAANGRGKRKLDFENLALPRKAINRLSRPPNLNRERIVRPPPTKRASSNRMLRVDLEAPGQRNTPVARIGRPRLVKEEVVEKVERHKGSVGFGLPGQPVRCRRLDEDIQGAPFFYFENVASMPNDEWGRIRRHLFDIEPEFVDSLHFSACRRPRGYIHNLPIEGRRKMLVDPPMTIQELLPYTKAFWPAWDPRTKLNCITTRMASDFVYKKLGITEGAALQTTDPSPEQQKVILDECRHWNLVWTGPNIPTPIKETEIEAMLGFDEGHSRNILSSRARYKALGNSFSVYTVAFHFSVLRPLYPKGIKVLSLFSGIGGAEVALHKVGIRLLVVVSVETDEGTRRCLESWWAASRQTGVLNQDFHDVKDLGRAQISELVNKYGGFDLIVGGSPCNNLSGSNQVSRNGLNTGPSSTFFEFSRIVTAVRDLTIRLQARR